LVALTRHALVALQLPVSAVMDKILPGMAKVFGFLLIPVFLLLMCGAIGAKVADKTKKD
jgi:hypothetical protein